MIVSLSNYLFILIIYFTYRLSFSVGIPAFNLNYLKSIIHHNYFSYLILSLILWLTQTQNFQFILPLFINTGFYLIKGINKYIKSNICSKIVSYNYRNYDLSLFIEVCNLISPIAGFFLGINRFYFIFIYLQYMKFRYYASVEIKNIMQELRFQIEVMSTNPYNQLERDMASIIKIIGTVLSTIFLGRNVMMINRRFRPYNIY